MSTLPGFAMQAAVFDVLKSSEALEVLVAARIYDAVPARALHPYLSYGPAILRDRSDSSGQGFDHIITINAYSRSPGFREAYAISDAVIAALNEAALEISGHRLILMRFDSADFNREADSITTRATLVFRAMTEEI